MWTAIYRCAVSDQGCDPVQRTEERHPVLDEVPPPVCTDHDLPMILQSCTPPLPTRKPTTIKRKGRGGFGAKQLPLWEWVA